MKHSHKETAVILGWTIFSMVLGVLFYPTVQVEEFTSFEQISLMVTIVAVILVGAVFWYAVLKFRKKALAGLYAFGVALMYSALVDYLFNLNDDVAAIFVRGGILIFGGVWYYSFIADMQVREWKTIQPRIQLNNLITLIPMAYIAVTIGKSLSVWLAMVLFVLISVYDGLAVWKLKTMQAMAIGFVAERVIPGIAWAKKKKEKFALLGGGDIFFLLLVPAAFALRDTVLAIGAMVSMFAAICILFYASSKNKFYPALPFMFAGLAIYLILWVVFGWLVGS
jgi:presenilin-like A22 family membrane protease